MRPITLTGMLLILAAVPGLAQEDERDARIRNLERKLEVLGSELEDLKRDRFEDRIEALEEAVEAAPREDSTGRGGYDWFERLSLGGYGEHHFNIEEADGADFSDIHRFVIQIDYDFNDWIHFTSETEIEHAFVNDGDGEISIEQFFVDFDVHEMASVRVGRVLTPLGIINQRHEPPTFHGVERPQFATRIIPSTWSSDGIGVHGRLLAWLTYEAYLVGSLDGSGFSDNGIRGGRIKERPSLHELAGTGRFDFFPLAETAVSWADNLRFGASYFFGGLDNGDQGNNPGVDDASIRIYSGDFEYVLQDFEFRGAVAFEEIEGAEKIGNNVAEGIFGWYLEGAYFWYPDAWRTGRFEDSDASVFVRYDAFDTQYNMPGGVDPNPIRQREEWTAGVQFWFTQNLVFKVDVQFPSDKDNKDRNVKFNLGLGFQF